MRNFAAAVLKGLRLNKSSESPPPVSATIKLRGNGQDGEDFSDLNLDTKETRLVGWERVRCKAAAGTPKTVVRLIAEDEQLLVIARRKTWGSAMLVARASEPGHVVSFRVRVKDATEQKFQLVYIEIPQQFFSETYERKREIEAAA